MDISTFITEMLICFVMMLSIGSTISTVVLTIKIVSSGRVNIDGYQSSLREGIIGQILSCLIIVLVFIYTIAIAKGDLPNPIVPVIYALGCFTRSKFDRMTMKTLHDMVHDENEKWIHRY